MGSNHSPNSCRSSAASKLKQSLLVIMIGSNRSLIIQMLFLDASLLSKFSNLSMEVFFHFLVAMNQHTNCGLHLQHTFSHIGRNSIMIEIDWRSGVSTHGWLVNRGCLRGGGMCTLVWGSYQCVWSKHCRLKQTKSVTTKRMWPNSRCHDWSLMGTWWW